MSNAFIRHEACPKCGSSDGLAIYADDGGAMSDYGRWTVIQSSGRKWLCLCECGQQKFVDKYNLFRGISKSCGCLARELTKVREKVHGMMGTETHSAWMSMCQRGRYNGSNGHYYEELGITVCERWEPRKGGSFLNFLEDMGEKPEGMTLDRIDNRIGYFKENCRWVNKSTQASNRRTFSTNSSGRTGVHYETSKDRWVAELMVQKVLVFKKRFRTFEEACIAMTAAEIKYLGYSREDY